MKKATYFSILLIIFIFYTCKGKVSKSEKNNTENAHIESIVNNELKFKMFCEALSNRSTAPNYVVVTVKNLITNEIKEICTEAPFLEGAIYIETGISSYSTICDDYPNRYFEFSKDSALYNISFDLYTKIELEEYEKHLDLPQIIKEISNRELIDKTFSGDRKEQIMFAHIMFNNGIMMTRGCVAGNICELYRFGTERINQVPLEGQ